MPLTPAHTHTHFLLYPHFLLIQNKNCMWSLWKYRLSQHGCVVDCTPPPVLLFNLLLPLHSPPPSLSSVRVLGVAVLSRWLVPTLTPSLTPGRGIESQDHRKAVEVTARHGPDWGWCSESRWVPTSGMSYLEGCWPLLLPSPPEGESQLSFTWHSKTNFQWFHSDSTAV